MVGDVTIRSGLIQEQGSGGYIIETTSTHDQRLYSRSYQGYSRNRINHKYVGGGSKLSAFMNRIIMVTTRFSQREYNCWFQLRLGWIQSAGRVINPYATS